MKETVNFSVEIPVEDIKQQRAGDISTISWSGTYGGTSNANFRMKLGISWSSVKHATIPFSDVTAKLWLHSAAIRTEGVAKTCTLNINGNSKSHSQAYNQGDWSSTFQIVLLEHSARIMYEGSKTITISGSFDVNITYSGVYVGTMSHSVSATLDTILSPPGAPTKVSLTGRFDNGMSTSLSWSGTTGSYTGHDIQRRFWKRTGTNTEVYSDWFDVEYNRYPDYREIQHSAVTDHAQQCRVRAVNAAGKSNWVESNWVYHDGVNVYTDNSGNKTYGKVRVWNGSSWVQGYVSVWTGSEWSTTK